MTKDLRLGSLRTALLGSAAIMTAAAVAPSAVKADEMSELKAQLDALNKRIGELEAKESVTPAPANAVVGGDFKDRFGYGSFKLPGSDVSLKFGAHVKLDIRYDVETQTGPARNGNQNVIDNNPAPFNRRSSLSMHARESRFHLDGRMPSKYGTVRGYFEAGFFNFAGGGDAAGAGAGPGDLDGQNVANNASLSLRHAFLSIGPWLAGQTWSLFTDLPSFGEKLNFSSPDGGSFIRQAQLRYTRKLGPGTFRFSIENPQVTANGGGFVAQDVSNDRLPDFLVSYTLRGKWGHVEHTAVLRKLQVETVLSAPGKPSAAPPGTLMPGSDESEFGWGVKQSGRFNMATLSKMFGQDNLKWEVIGGDGVGRYLQRATGHGVQVTATPSLSNNDLDTVSAFGATAAYQHFWTPLVKGVGGWRSTFIGGYARVWRNNRDVNVSPAGADKAFTSLTGNLLWNPVRGARVGVEVWWTRRQLNGPGSFTGPGGGDGSEVTIISSAQYDF